MPKRGEGLKVCTIFYLEHFVFMSWLIGAFDLVLRLAHTNFKMKSFTLLYNFSIFPRKHLLR